MESLKAQMNPQINLFNRLGLLMATLKTIGLATMWSELDFSCQKLSSMKSSQRLTETVTTRMTHSFAPLPSIPLSVMR